VKSGLLATDSSTFLLSQQPSGAWEPSAIYHWPDAIKALTNMHVSGVASSTFWLGDDSANGWKYGLVSFAAFLAQSMKETIKYDACDENNWDSTSGNSAANACGQLGQSYQDYKCAAGQEHYQCDVDTSLEIRADTHAKWWGAPAPFFCAPKTVVPVAPKWNSYGGSDCAGGQDVDMSFDEYINYMLTGGTCRDYDFQKGGGWEQCAGGCPNAPAPNFGRAARTDVEGCCYWGRGVIQTTGVCNFGKLNYFLGAKAKARTGSALFGDIDFCRNPQAICSDPAHPELKWVAGLYYYMTEVQPWADTEFNYIAQVKAFVDGGMAGSDTAFIDAVSGIVNRGCPRLSCAAGAVDGAADRRTNFRTVLAAMQLV
jgi:predicted chitinase